jgi:hypothetical protein
MGSAIQLISDHTTTLTPSWFLELEPELYTVSYLRTLIIIFITVSTSNLVQQIDDGHSAWVINAHPFHF